MKDRLSLDTRWRLAMVGFGLSFLAFAVGYAQVSDLVRWNPRLVAVLAFTSALNLLILAMRPATAFAYQLGGTFAEGTMIAHIASIGLGAANYSASDVTWLVLAHLAFTGMLMALFSGWWLSDVKRWHHEHEARAR